MNTDALESATADDSNPYTASARIAAAMASLDGEGSAEAEPAAGQTAPAATLGGAPAEGGEGQATTGEPVGAEGQAEAQEPDPFDPAELRRLANERARERETGKPPEAAPAAPAPGVDMERLAELLNRPTTEREAIEQLKRTGDVAGLAQLLGEDPGTLTEKIIQQGVEPGSVRVQSELEATKRELAELKAMLTGEDPAVVTREALDKQLAASQSEYRLQAYQEQLAASYDKVGADAERYPLQANLAQDLRMKYALEADALLIKARGPEARFGITAEDIAEVTERELRKLAQSLGGASTHAAGSQSAAGRSSATHTNTRGVGTLSNANASETVGAPANPYDMAARRKAALEALDE